MLGKVSAATMVLHLIYSKVIYLQACLLHTKPLLIVSLLVTVMVGDFVVVAASASVHCCGQTEDINESKRIFTHVERETNTQKVRWA